MYLNPLAFLIWIFVGLVGYLFSGDVKTGVFCGTSMMGVSLLITLFK